MSIYQGTNDIVAVVEQADGSHSITGFFNNINNDAYFYKTLGVNGTFLLSYFAPSQSSPHARCLYSMVHRRCSLA